jgi:hypothetical protein
MFILRLKNNFGKISLWMQPNDFYTFIFNKIYLFLTGVLYIDFCETTEGKTGCKLNGLIFAISGS